MKVIYQALVRSDKKYKNEGFFANKFLDKYSAITKKIFRKIYCKKTFVLKDV